MIGSYNTNSIFPFVIELATTFIGTLLQKASIYRLHGTEPNECIVSRLHDRERAKLGGGRIVPHMKSQLFTSQ